MEYITNGNFNGNANGWTLQNGTVDDGWYYDTNKVTFGANGPLNAYQATVLTPGNYTLTFDLNVDDVIVLSYFDVRFYSTDLTTLIERDAFLQFSLTDGSKTVNIETANFHGQNVYLVFQASTGGYLHLTNASLIGTNTSTDRYWVDGTGDWSDTSHWSSTSGGSGGFSVPTTGNVFIDSNSGLSGGIITLDTVVTIDSLTSSPGYSYTIEFPAGETTTITDLMVNGIVDNLILFRSTIPGTQATLSSESVTLSYIDVQDMIATGTGSPFDDLTGGVDSGNNINWRITTPQPALSQIFKGTDY
jgi:hypothetical protein